eukprot:1455305-Alexandrium_andersonii.AAC.1
MVGPVSPRGRQLVPRGKSAHRCCWPTGGAEWALLQRCKTFGRAIHVCRLLGNGVQGDAVTRSTADRRERRR